jgi:C-1 hydroxylase
MSTVENKALVSDLIEAWNRGDIDAMAQLWGPGMVHHGRNSKADSHATAAAMSGFQEAFPDLRMDVESLVAEDDLVATRLTIRGTHTGEYMGIPATGQRIQCQLMGQLRVRDGAVVEHWGVADTMQILLQLGLLPREFSAAFT